MVRTSLARAAIIGSLVHRRRRRRARPVARRRAGSRRHRHRPPAVRAGALLRAGLLPAGLLSGALRLCAAAGLLRSSSRPTTRRPRPPPRPLRPRPTAASAASTIPRPSSAARRSRPSAPPACSPTARGASSIERAKSPVRIMSKSFRHIARAATLGAAALALAACYYVPPAPVAYGPCAGTRLLRRAGLCLRARAMPMRRRSSARSISASAAAIGAAVAAGAEAAIGRRATMWKMCQCFRVPRGVTASLSSSSKSSVSNPASSRSTPARS